MIALLPLLVAGIFCPQTAAEELKRPAFADYPATEHFSGRPVRVDSKSHPDAPQFAQVLRTGAAKGPNFAGAYTIVMPDCGKGCQMIVVVSARTGRVVFGPQAALGAEFHSDSRLLVVNPPELVAKSYPDVPPPPEAWTRTYQWQDGALVRVSMRDK